MKILSFFSTLALLIALLAPTKSFAEALALSDDAAIEAVHDLNMLGLDGIVDGTMRARVDQVLYDYEAETFVIIYRSRVIGSRKPFGKPQRLEIKGITFDKIFEGDEKSRFLNEAIIKALYDALGLNLEN